VFQEVECKTVGLQWWCNCQYKAPVAFPSRKYFWYSFLAGSVSLRRPYCGRKDYVNEKFQWPPLGIEPATFQLVGHWFNQFYFQVLEKRHQLFFCSNLSNQRYQPSVILQWNTNRYDSYGQVMFSTASCMLVPTAYTRSGYWKWSVLLFCFYVMLLPPEEHKINKRTCNG